MKPMKCDKEINLPPFGVSDDTKQKMAQEMGEAEFEEMQGDLIKAEDKDDERMENNVDSIAAAIMSSIDAVDMEEGSKIKTIMIEIGLE